MTLVCLVAALVAVGPRQHADLHSKPSAVESPGAGQSMQAAGLFPSRRLQRVIVGDLTELAADSRHSAGADLAIRLNAAHDGLSGFGPATPDVVTGDLTRLAADRTHTRGADLAKHINLQNDGLTRFRNDAELRQLTERGSPRLIGWALVGFRMAAISARRFAETNYETLGGAALQAKPAPRWLAAKGWSGCTAYSSDSAKRHGRLLLNGPVNVRQASLLRLDRKLLVVRRLRRELLSAAAGITWWLGRSEQAWTAAVSRTRTVRGGAADRGWRSAKAASWGQVGL